MCRWGQFRLNMRQRDAAAILLSGPFPGQFVRRTTPRSADTARRRLLCLIDSVIIAWEELPVKKIRAVIRTAPCVFPRNMV